ncbi:MAG: BPSL0067 family protein, partial [Tagaea sp.]|nr:BPSL0067 family protein [Tagaea sp.]
MRTRPWEPKDPAAQAPAQSDIRDMAWRPGRDGEAQPMPLPDKIRTPEEEARDIVPISYDTRAGTQAPVHDDGMLDPAKWPEYLRAQGQAAEDEPQEEVEIEGGETEDVEIESEATATDYADEEARALQTAQGLEQQPRTAPERPPVSRTEGAWIVDKPESLRDTAQANGGWLGVRANGQPSRECVGLVQFAVPNIGHTSTWRAGDRIAPADPSRQAIAPGTAVATFEANANGVLRYPNRDTGNHAGIFVEYGTRNGREGIWMIDQFRNGETALRHYPFERSSGERGYRAGDF